MLLSDVVGSLGEKSCFRSSNQVNLRRCASYCWSTNGARLGKNTKADTTHQPMLLVLHGEHDSRSEANRQPLRGRVAEA